MVFETKYGAVQEFQTANNAGKGQNRSTQDHPWIPLGLPWTPWALKTPQGAHSDLHIHPISSLHLLYYLLSLSNRPILRCHPKKCSPAPTGVFYSMMFTLLARIYQLPACSKQQLVVLTQKRTWMNV